MKRFLKLTGTVCVMSLGLTSPSLGADIDWRQFEGTTINGIVVNDPITTSYLEPQIKAFEELTGITVRMEKLNGGPARQKLDIVLGGGDTSLDFFQLQMEDRGGAYTNAGYLEDLAPYMANSALTPADYNYEGDWSDGCLGTNVVLKDQPLNNLVFSAGAQVLHIRKDLFEEYGVKVPETLEELEIAAQKLTLKDDKGRIDTYGFLSRGAGQIATTTFATFLRNMGGSWFTEVDGVKKSNIASPESLKALEYYGKLLREYGPEAALVNNAGANASLFAAGKVAMIAELNQFTSMFNDPSRSRVAGKVDTILIPYGDGGSYPNIPTTSFVISSKSTKKDATWLFLAWMTSPEQMLFGVKNGAPMCRESVWEDPSYEPPTEAWGEASFLAVKYGRALGKPPAIAIGEVREAVAKVIDVAIRDGSPEAIKAEAEKQAAFIDELVAKTESADDNFIGAEQVGQPSVPVEDQRKVIELVGLE